MAEEDIPYVEPPDELDDDAEKNGLVCFISMDRVCSPDCMAYTTEPSEARFLNDQQKHCVLIVGVERLARHTGGVLRLLLNSRADSARPSAKPPNPMGGA